MLFVLLCCQVAAANKELGELQAARKNAERQAELQDKLAELEAAAANPWLNENPDQAASALSPARVSMILWPGWLAVQDYVMAVSQAWNPCAYPQSTAASKAIHSAWLVA